MSYQVLARKWRPKSFQQLVGQTAVVQSLVNGLDNDRVHHAFLFTGTRGVGKTTIARILAKCLNCTTGVTSTPCGECSACVEIDEGRFHDMQEIDAASRTGVDDMRELIENVQYAPGSGRFKVYIIDEVHMLSTASFNALLKTLEEPPPHVKFVLATTDPQKIPVTILSRCLRFSLRRLLPDQITPHLEQILTDEGIKSEPSAVDRIARAADGSMRDALSLLDQAIAFGGGELKDEQVAQMMGSVDHEHIANIVDALADSDAANLLEIVRELSAQARDLESVLLDLAEVMHRISLVQLAPDYRDPERTDWDSIVRLSGRLSPEDAQLFYQIAIQGKRDLGMAPDPRTGLEMSLLRMLAFKPQQSGSQTSGEGGERSQARQAGSGKSSPAAAVATAKAEPAAQAKPRAQASREPKRAKPEPAVEAPAVATSALATSSAPPALDVAGPELDDWHGLMQRLKLNGPVRELARNIQLQSRKGSQWMFLIPDSVQHLGSSNLVKKLQTELTSQLGQQVNVSLNTASEPVQSPAMVSEQASMQRMSEAEKSISEDPTVRQLKEQFDAKLVDESIQPLQ